MPVDKVDFCINYVDRWKKCQYIWVAVFSIIIKHQLIKQAWERFKEKEENNWRTWSKINAYFFIACLQTHKFVLNFCEEKWNGLGFLHEKELLTYSFI